MSERLDDLSAEVKRLRDWRHDVVAPALLVLSEGHKQTVATLAKVVEQVDGMHDEQEFAKRVAVEMRKRRVFALTAFEKTLLLLVGVVPLANFILRLLGIGG